MQKYREDLALEYPEFHILCPTRQTVRGESLKSILNKWAALKRTCDESLDQNFDAKRQMDIIIFMESAYRKWCHDTATTYLGHSKTFNYCMSGRRGC